jgi:hypothetical protein
MEEPPRLLLCRVFRRRPALREEVRKKRTRFFNFIGFDSLFGAGEEKFRAGTEFFNRLRD